MSADALTLTVPVRDSRTQPTPAQFDAIRGFLQRREGKDVVLKLARPGSTRSLNQNRYLWGVVYTEIGNHTGHTTEDIHEVCKDLFLPRKFVKLGRVEKEVRKTTTDLTPGEFESYLESVRAWAAQELQLRIPMPGE